MLYLALDLTASNSENIKVKNYPIRTDLTAEQGQVIVGEHGVFHTVDLVVKHIETDSELVLDKDYYLTYYSNHLKANYGIDGFAGIVLANKTLTGNVEVSARYVGGGYGQFNPTYIVDVVTLYSGVPENLEWDNVLNAPAAAAPNAHKLPAENIATGYQDFVAVLHQVYKAMQAVAEKHDNTRIPIGAKISTIAPNNLLNSKYWLLLDGQTITRGQYPMLFHVLGIEEDTLVLDTEANTYVRVN